MRPLWMVSLLVVGAGVLASGGLLPQRPALGAAAAPVVNVTKLDYGLKARTLADGVYVVEGAVDDFAVANGCHVQVTSLATGDEEVSQLMDRFNAACQAHPEVSRPDIMMLMHTYVAESEEELAQGTLDLQKFYTYFGKWARRERPIQQGFMEAIRQEDLDAAPSFAPDKLRKNLVVGTPTEVIARLKAYEAMGYDQYSLWLDNHMDFERKRRCLQLFIDRVMPSFA